MAKTALQLAADMVAKKHKITIKEAEKLVSSIFEVIQEGLDNDKIAKVKGLGTFKVQAVKPRESINVNTGERVLIEGHDKVSFTPDATMKELVNKPFSQFETVVLNDGVDFDNEEVAKKQESGEDADLENSAALSETTVPFVDSTEKKEESKSENGDKIEEKTENSESTVKVEENVETTDETAINKTSINETAINAEETTDVVEEQETQTPIAAEKPVLSPTQPVETPQTIAQEQSKVAEEEHKPSENKIEPVRQNSETAVQEQPKTEEEKCKSSENELKPVRKNSEITVQEQPQKEEEKCKYSEDELKPVQQNSETAVQEQSKTEEEKCKSSENELKPVRKDSETIAQQTKVIQKQTEECEITEEQPHKKNKVIWIAAASICLIIALIFFSYNFGKNYALRNNQIASTQTQTPKARTNIVQKQPKDNKKPVESSATQAATNVQDKVEVNEFRQLSSDKRIRYGAYDIVGIEKTVVLKKGETMESYSRKALGPDMVGYFQVLNNAATMIEGDTMKVPKVQLRPEYIGK